MKNSIRTYLSLTVQKLKVLSKLKLNFLKTVPNHLNKSRKSFVIEIWPAESVIPGGKAPRESKISVRVRALTVMDLESQIICGLPPRMK